MPMAKRNLLQNYENQEILNAILMYEPCGLIAYSSKSFSLMSQETVLICILLHLHTNNLYLDLGIVVSNILNSEGMLPMQ